MLSEPTMRQQMIFELRPKVRMRQQRVNSRTTRQLAGDLQDLERELAQTNSALFEKTGLSWARPDIERSWAGQGRLVVDQDRGYDLMEGLALPRDEARIAEKFPDQTRKVDRLIEERRLLLGRMAARDKDVAKELTDWPRESPGLFPGPGIDWDRVEKGTFSPWLYMDSVKFPFPDPFFYDSCFAEEVGEEDLELTPDYQFVRPWFFNDTDESKVAQFHADLRDGYPWPGSWQAYMLHQQPHRLHPNSAFGHVLQRVATARRRRAAYARQVRDKELVGDQLPLFQEEHDALQVPGDVRRAHDGTEAAAGLLRAQAEGLVDLVAHAGG